MIRLDKNRFELILMITLEKDSGEGALRKYEALMRKNHIDDEVFANMVRYQVTKKEEYLHQAKEQAIPGITFDNFMESDILLEYLDIMLEEMEYELKNSMRIVTRKEEYDYYQRVINDVINYSSEHYEGIYHIYVTVRLYKIAKLVWYQNAMASHYPLIEDLYHLMKREKFDYYLFKMNGDLIKMAEINSHYDEEKVVSWKAKSKQYKEDEKGLLYLLDLHPFFSTKSLVFWLYYISEDATEFFLENVYESNEILKDPAFFEIEDLLFGEEPSCELYRSANEIIIQVLNDRKDEWKNDPAKIKQILDLIKIMRNLNLNHYDVTYILQYLDLEAEYEYRWNKVRNIIYADKIYLRKLKRNKSVAWCLNENILVSP